MKNQNYICDPGLDYKVKQLDGHRRETQWVDSNGSCFEDEEIKISLRINVPGI